MVIVTGTHGQFCNQLFRMGHHVANALHLDYEVNCAEFEYQSLFPNLTRHRLISDKPLLSGLQSQLLKLGTRRFLQKPIRRLFKQQGYVLLDRAYNFDPADTTFVQQATQEQLIATDWEFRDYESLNTKYDTLAELFALPAQQQDEGAGLVAKAREKSDFVIGVHLRRGDYAQWHNGIYYYDDATYLDMMTHITTLLPDRRVSFLICSNEPVDQDAYEDFPVVVSDKSFLADLAGFSRCDLLIGPPSTFSGWASFIGQVPHYHVYEANNRPALSDFAIARG